MGSTPATDLRAHGSSQPIANYGLLADCNSAALVDRDGAIDWLCLPRYESDAVFARILDRDAGHWSVRPRGEYSSQRRYLPGTLIVETVFTTDTGSVRLLDAMAFSEGQRGHELGHGAPHELLRSLEGLSGSVELDMELAPRPEYGLVRPLVRLEDGGARTFGTGHLTVSSARGTFVICSFWLVSCLAKAGELERAEALFDQLAGYANDLGLLAEEIDTDNGEQLGNFPQAFSHIGLITAAYEIDKAQGEVE